MTQALHMSRRNQGKSYDVIILAGVAIYRRWFERVGFNPRFLPKANTVIQINTLALLLVASYPVI